MSGAGASDAAARAWRIALWSVLALTAIRIAVLVLSPLQLYPDEAQYWWWAQTPDFGYFSKPPLIAWIIWTTTHLFGNAEWAVRIASPVLHAGTALVLFAIGREIGDERLGMWSALAYATLPGVAYSAGLVSTDVPLLLCWAVALYALLRAGTSSHWRWPLLCGAAIGAGLLAKYAMLYFVAGAAIVALLSPRIRQAGRGGRALAMAAAALLVFSPNIAWNVTHHFPTVGHTAHNADWNHARYSFDSLASFLIGQFGVFGPAMMAAFFVALWRLFRRKGRDDGMAIAASFALPPLLLMLVQSFISEANANWAATAYVSATPLAVAVLLDVPWALVLSLALNTLAMAVLWIIMLWPQTGDALGIGNAFKRQEGWSRSGTAVVEAARSGRYEAIAVVNRSLIAELTYYAMDRPAPLRAWSRDSRITDHFEMTMRLAPTRGHVLLVLLPGEEAMVRPTFDSAAPVARIDIPIGGHHRRIIALYDARGYAGPKPQR